MRTITAPAAMLATILLFTGCVSNELAWCSSHRPVPRFGSNRLVAIEVLAASDRLESSHTGEGGAPSCFVTSYRHILGSRDAARTFESLFEKATPAGKVYALAGLYETDRAAFERLVGAAEASSPPVFERIDTCIVSAAPRQVVFDELRKGKLSAWWRPYPAAQ